MTLANCLNLPCRIFKQFACFSDAFKSSLKKKDSVKYFNKPKPCGIFFRCLNSTPLTPVHPPTVLYWLAFHSIFFPCLSICHQSVGFVTSTYLWVCFPPSNCFVIYKAHTHTKSSSHTQQILMFWAFMTIILDIKAVHEPKNLFHRITILIHRSQIWTVFFYMTLFSGICQLVSIFTSGITSPDMANSRKGTQQSL